MVQLNMWKPQLRERKQTIKVTYGAHAMHYLKFLSFFLLVPCLYLIIVVSVLNVGSKIIQVFNDKLMLDPSQLSEPVAIVDSSLLGILDIWGFRVSLPIWGLGFLFLFFFLSFFRFVYKEITNQNNNSLN
ncbi:hypothetical protein PIB30_042687 [Stylosanthes scabra]|uniref:Uncharacterized protein n=1 Tax=Stylosanthes scabra TaxID=79078 RepID=A0ABU6VHK3_9FABA|nr:hypothetical protein [Stylosanthes scabra]